MSFFHGVVQNDHLARVHIIAQIYDTHMVNVFGRLFLPRDPPIYDWMSNIIIGLHMRIGLIFKNNLGLSINIFSVKSLQFTHELSICINVLCSKNLNEFATQWLKL